MRAFKKQQQLCLPFPSWSELKICAFFLLALWVISRTGSHLLDSLCSVSPSLIPPLPILQMKRFPLMLLSPRVALLWSGWINHRDKWIKPLMSWHGSGFQQLPLDSMGTAFPKVVEPAVSIAAASERCTICPFKSVSQQRHQPTSHCSLYLFATQFPVSPSPPLLLAQDCLSGCTKKYSSANSHRSIKIKSNQEVC